MKNINILHTINPWTNDQKSGFFQSGNIICSEMSHGTVYFQTSIDPYFCDCFLGWLGKVNACFVVDTQKHLIAASITVAHSTQVAYMFILMSSWLLFYGSAGFCLHLEHHLRNTLLYLNIVLVVTRWLPVPRAC